MYVYYAATSPAIHNRISRFTANGDVAVAGSETVILELDNLSGATNHNGGALALGAISSRGAVGLVVSGPRRLEAVPQIVHQLCVSRVLADRIEQRICDEPGVAREPVVDRRSQPRDRFRRTPELGERGAQTVRDVVVHRRALLDGFHDCSRGVRLARGGQHRGQHGLRSDIGRRAALDACEQLCGLLVAPEISGTRP